VDHIGLRPVPEDIRRPNLIPPDLIPREKILLGGEEETKLREAAGLAARVREFVGGLVKVGNFSEHA
jgi:methionyl aminopeptidase